MDYADLRTGIQNHLVTEIPAVTGVFWRWTAPADTVKPFILMSFGGELPSANGNTCGVFQQLDVEVYGDETSIHLIDPVADAVFDALHQVPITTPDGRIIYLRYVPGSRFDDGSDKFKASMIRLKFSLPTDIWAN